MNDLRYGQYNLKANTARHFKKYMKVTEKKLLGKTKHKAKQSVPKKERDSRSYKEVLSPSKTDHVYEPKQSGDTSSQSCVEEVRYNISTGDSLWLTIKVPLGLFWTTLIAWKLVTFILIFIIIKRNE